MAKLAEKAHETPNTVKATLARRWDNLEAQAVAKITNSKKVKQAGELLNRIHRNG